MSETTDNSQAGGRCAPAAGSEAPQYEFTRCGGVIMLMVPRFTDHGMPCAGETFHGISEKTARQLRDQLNALLPPNAEVSEVAGRNGK